MKRNDSLDPTCKARMARDCESPCCRTLKRTPGVGITTQLWSPLLSSRVLAQDTVVLLRVHNVVPEPAVIRGDFVVDHRPVLLEPFVQPGKQNGSGGAGLLNFPSESRIDRGHRAFVVATVTPSVRMNVRDAATRRHSVLRDQRGQAGVIVDQGPEVSEITGAPLG